MAKGVATHSCGHQSTVVEHSRREVERRIARLRNEPCWDCDNRERAARLTAMAEAAGARTRIEHLREALDLVARPGDILIAFSSSAVQINSAADLPAPSGGTALELALMVAARHNPVATLVVSDGKPNSPEQAMKVASQMTGRIDALYCGDERDQAALDFMARLAREGSGRVVRHSWAHATNGTPALASSMRRLLIGAPK